MGIHILERCIKFQLSNAQVHSRIGIRKGPKGLPHLGLLITCWSWTAGPVAQCTRGLVHRLANWNHGSGSGEHQMLPQICYSSHFFFQLYMVTRLSLFPHLCFCFSRVRKYQCLCFSESTLAWLFLSLNYSFLLSRSTIKYRKKEGSSSYWSKIEDAWIMILGGWGKYIGSCMKKRG